MLKFLLTLKDFSRGSLPNTFQSGTRRGNPEQKVNEMSKNSRYDYFFTHSMWRIPENVPCSMKLKQFFCILFPLEKLGIKLSDACFELIVFCDPF